MNILEQAKKIALTADVKTPQNSVVLYSISYLPSKENKEQALQYIKNNPQSYLLDNTECGQKLIAMGLETGNEILSSEILKIWALASERFIQSASGNITAFVKNADKRSTFVSVELPNILKNSQIVQINGIDKFEFAQQFK